MLQFILSQIFGLISLIFVVISYFLNKKWFLIFQIFANAFYGASFLASFALVGGINTFVSIIRVLVFYFYEKHNKTIPKIYFFIFSIIYLTVGIVFYKNPWDIITMSTPMMFTLAMMFKNMLIVNYAMLVPNILICIYCSCNKFYTSAILDFTEITIIIVAIITYYIKKNSKIKNENLDQQVLE